MPTLRARRAEAAEFDPRFFERSPLFWPIAKAARSFVECNDWPEPATLTATLGGAANIGFEAAAPRPRRRSAPVEERALYDARIVLDRCVPTRARSWHDLLNALVWATFPRAKSALHARQHRALVVRIVPGATRLPETRSREHDALALIDEGGVVVLEGPNAPAVSLIFGHALYEGLVLGVRAMIARAVVARMPRVPDEPEEQIAFADLALEERLRTPDLVPESLPRYGVLKDEPWAG
jgi:hypothetical protein